MMATLKLVAELGLNADDTRAAVAGRRMVIGMAQVGALMAAKRTTRKDHLDDRRRQMLQSPCRA
jgi:hypothetical protein